MNLWARNDPIDSAGNGAGPGPLLLSREGEAGVLLTQPGGFEGGLALHEDPHPSDPAVCKVVDVGDREVVVDSTDAPAHGGPEKAENPIRADALQALDGQPEVRPSILDIGEKAPNAASAFLGTLDLGGRRKQLDALRAASEVAVDISLVQGGNSPPHDLHVLLRHRLGSISALTRT